MFYASPPKSRFWAGYPVDRLLRHHNLARKQPTSVLHRASRIPPCPLAGRSTWVAPFVASCGERLGYIQEQKVNVQRRARASSRSVKRHFPFSAARVRVLPSSAISATFFS
jgi:hypothetical protein